MSLNNVVIAHVTDMFGEGTVVAFWAKVTILK